MRVAAKGWCPGAYRPMDSGDGLIVRVRPVLARLTAHQVLGLCAAALAHGSGIVELTNRANVQVRGVRAGAHEALLEELWTLGLLDADPGVEGRRNVLVAPLWAQGDMTEQVARGLIARLGELPDLPAKFGFAVDCGGAPGSGGRFGRYPGGARGVGRADPAGGWVRTGGAGYGWRRGGRDDRAGAMVCDDAGECGAHGAAPPPCGGRGGRGARSLVGGCRGRAFRRRGLSWAWRSGRWRPARWRVWSGTAARWRCG